MSEHSNPGYQEDLIRRCKAEAHEVPAGLTFPVYLDLTCSIAIIGHLQLALRHPGTRGPSAEIARQFIDRLIARMRECGYSAHAELAEAGDNPEMDS